LLVLLLKSTPVPSTTHPDGQLGQLPMNGVLAGKPRNCAAALHVVADVMPVYPAGQTAAPKAARTKVGWPVCWSTVAGADDPTPSVTMNAMQVCVICWRPVFDPVEHEIEH